ncbi:MAG: acyl-CoA dehydrogenase family protein [Chloroflexi bacterium]|nr:acyl-CoA dehydrogenase family protein [Chloroflexota bacterium]
MDFKYHYTEEQEEFRREVRAWVKANVPPEMRAPYGQFRDLPEHVYKFWRTKHMKLAEKGWFYPMYPKQYGGGGLTPEHEVILAEEFERGRVRGSMGNSFALPALLVWATEEQKQKFLVPLLKTEKVSFQAFTEPQSGSDLAGIQSRAVRDGDDWLITGQKIFISGQGEPDWLFGPILTDLEAPRHRNMGFFMIPYPSKGLELRRQNLLNGYDQNFVFMDNVRVPGDHLIGGDHQGWQVTGSSLEIEHGGRGSPIQRDVYLEKLLAYTRQATRLGKSLGSDEIHQQTAMEAYMDSHVSGLFALRNYSMYQARQELSYHGSQNSLYGREYRIRNANRARDLMGMYSLVGETDPLAPVEGTQEQFQRGSLVGAHPGGAIEVQKVIVARRLGISRTRERAAATPSTAGVSGV